MPRPEARQKRKPTSEQILEKQAARALRRAAVLKLVPSPTEVPAHVESSRQDRTKGLLIAGAILAAVMKHSHKTGTRVEEVPEIEQPPEELPLPGLT